MLKVLTGALAAALTIACSATPAAAASPFSDWAAVVVAGDWHAHSGEGTEAFDNARRDVAARLVSLGFSESNIRQFSTRPDRYPDLRPQHAQMEPIYRTLTDLARQATGGCLFYITSHGGPQGVVLDEDGETDVEPMTIVPPSVLAELLDTACPNRPSVVVISACFSGVFLPALSSNQRMIMTAARSDRSSFGCGVDNKYPYFDECFLSASQVTKNFPQLAAAAQACVRDKEIATGAEPPSEPQVWIGPAIRPMLPLYAFPQPVVSP